MYRAHTRVYYPLFATEFRSRISSVARRVIPGQHKNATPHAGGKNTIKNQSRQCNRITGNRIEKRIVK